MNIKFPAIDDHYIKLKVHDGFYANETELVRDAVRRLREGDDIRHHRLMAALDIGDEAYKSGNVEPYTPGLLERIDREALKNSNKTKKVRL